MIYGRPGTAGDSASRRRRHRRPCAEDGDGTAREEKSRLTALQGLAALSLDALSSVAYGPEAIVVVLAAAGTAALEYTVPVTLAIVALLAILVISYRQVIAAFPNGGGAYAVARTHLGRQPSLMAGASLIIDYVLNAAVGVSAGIAALTSAFPVLYGARVWLCLAALALITGINMRGVAGSARVFMVPTLLFIAAIGLVIAAGLLRGQPAVPRNTSRSRRRRTRSDRWSSSRSVRCRGSPRRGSPPPSPSAKRMKWSR